MLETFVQCIISVMAVLVNITIILQMYEADFQDWGPPPSDENIFVDKTVKPLQLKGWNH